MRERNIPFVTYSGYDGVDEDGRGGAHVKKPGSMSALAATFKV